ncbi:hypothetical protein APHAL10511_005208 [Amanita phalloides]|nr:hypothetical protein APHAL10511_005208 [Amanita phalloides]
MSQPATTSSLLSLSIAAANAQPIPLPGPAARHHRRLSSTGKTRRRLSDARDAANRPTSATAAALSLASLSLSSSPPPAHHISTSLGLTSDALVNGTPPPVQGNYPQTLKLEPAEYATTSNKSPNATSPIPITNGKNRKRGVDHKCESCSKIYRHPSCLIKHRWEHTPHWREASKYVLSKHQQVQLLEAAAILSHLSPSSSLPEDRSLWPSFLSGGSLPPPENTNIAPYSISYNSGYRPVSPTQSPPSPTATKQTSISVPGSGTNCSHHSSWNGAGPRLHDFDLPASNNGVALRPGLVSMPNATSSDGISTPTPGGLAKSVPTRTSVPPLMEEDKTRREIISSALEQTWPRSRSGSDSVSVSVASGSRSRSTSTSGEEEDEMLGSSYAERHWRSFVRRYSDEDGVQERPQWDHLGKDKMDREPEWDGMDLEMDMD